ncbi:MAG: oxidoreductase, partial [Prevotellaceae bacterium]|nr:oxidoreductase [Prevotellaceae bacterium]
PRKGAATQIRPTSGKNEYYYEVAEFINLILSGQKESSVNTLHNSLVTIEILDEIRRQLNIRFPADKTL